MRQVLQVGVLTLPLIQTGAMTGRCPIQKWSSSLLCQFLWFGVERFAHNTLIDLPTAAKGDWLNENTFHLELNLVAAINLYDVTLTFRNEESLGVLVKERTGLNREEITGVRQLGGSLFAKDQIVVTCHKCLAKADGLQNPSNLQKTLCFS